MNMKTSRRRGTHALWSLVLVSAVAGAQTGPNNRVPDFLPVIQADTSGRVMHAPDADAWYAQAADGMDVGDADSFGRAVTYLGVVRTPGISFKTHCTNSQPAPARCITLNHQPALTSFNENKLASIVLPAKATNSLLCLAVTPSASFTLHNQTGVAQPMAKFGVRPTVVIESELLNDPSLIDPTTGAPFNGRISTQLTSYFESRNMDAGERESKTIFMTRHCIDGINRHWLKDTYGLPAAIADNFFSHPVTLIFGAKGDVQLVSLAGYAYGVRVYGD